MKLHLTLSKKWFDIISSGEKLEEYREIKPYWVKRLLPKSFSEVKNPLWQVGENYPTKHNFTSVVFKNGYQKDAQTCEVEFLGLSIDYPKIIWSDSMGFQNYVFVIKLGKIIQ